MQIMPITTTNNNNRMQQKPAFGAIIRDPNNVLKTIVATLTPEDTEGFLKLIDPQNGEISKIVSEEGIHPIINLSSISRCSVRDIYHMLIVQSNSTGYKSESKVVNNQNGRIFLTKIEDILNNLLRWDSNYPFKFSSIPSGESNGIKHPRLSKSTNARIDEILAQYTKMENPTI